jgi:sulfofructose kinase
MSQSATTKRFDVLGLGAVAIDDILYVDSYPQADAKRQVMQHERQCGGLTATALVAAARLGSACAYAGVLGTDELSDFAMQRFAEENIDVTQTVRKPDANAIHSTIIVDKTTGTRNIFFNLNGVVGAGTDSPDEEVIRGSKVLFVDNIGMAGMIRAARIASQAGIPIVADLEAEDSPYFADLFALADHLILSEDFARKITGRNDLADALEKLWSPNRQTAIITCGSEGCWAFSRELGSPAAFPAFKVEAVDTTGCGDVFHGAYASALAKGYDVRERIRWASASAALKATQYGGQNGIPYEEEVRRFLALRA